MSEEKQKTIMLIEECADKQQETCSEDCMDVQQETCVRDVKELIEPTRMKQVDCDLVRK